MKREEIKKKSKGISTKKENTIEEIAKVKSGEGIYSFCASICI